MQVKLYALSTCPYCRMTRQFLDDSGVDYELAEVDLMEGDGKAAAVEEVKRISGGTSFPVLVAGEEVVVGYNKRKVKKVLGL